MTAFMSKFLYDLFGVPEPSIKDLDNEIDRLFFIKGNVGEPTFLIEWVERDILGPLDAEVIANWLTRKFEPALVMMFIDSEDNYHKTKSELSKMGTSRSFIDKILKHIYINRRAHQRIAELCFDQDYKNINLDNAIIKLKRTLTFLSKHLEQNYSTDSSINNLTLQNTEAYTVADITLYNYLKRIIVGRYKDFGLRSHIKLCDSLVKFMTRYERKNPHIEPARESSVEEETTLIQELSKPAIVAFGVILFFLWRCS